MRIRGNDIERREIPSVTGRIAGQQAVPAMMRVSANEKIGQRPFACATGPAVSGMGQPSLVRRSEWEVFSAYLQLARIRDETVQIHGRGDL
jgi:hypothetical protein